MTLFKKETFAKDVHKALRAWHQTSGTDENMLSYLLLVQSARIENSSPSRRLATNIVLEDGLALLGQRNQEGMRVLRSRFQDGMIAQHVANQLNCSIDHVNRLQRIAIEELSLILLEAEEKARSAWIIDWQSRLPVATYSQLVGVDKVLDLLVEQFVAHTAEAKVVALCGIGGIGKTSLAHAATCQLIERAAFDAFVWLRVDPSKLERSFATASNIVDWVVEDLANRLLPKETVSSDASERLRQVRQLLNTTPHLVVLDNFESHTDISLLLTYLVDWAGVSQFLVTTRVRPVNSAEIFIITLEELEETQAAGLIRNHAKAIHLPELVTANDEQTKPIYKVVGGNPLALKLVVSLAAIMPIRRILHDLEKNRTGEVEDLYRYIYFQAWKVLSEQAKNLLQAMALVTDEGASVEHLQRISKLSEELFWSAIPELVSRSLIEVRGTTYDRRYGCHRLTRTFLRHDILGWDD